MSFSNDTPIYLSNQLPISLDVNPDEENFGQLLVLYLRRIANAVNTKENGLYLLEETSNFKQYFTYTTGTTPNPQENRNSYRLTVDLVSLFNQVNSTSGVPIPNGITNNLTLSGTTIPTAINGYLYPVSGGGAALDSTGISYFLNDMNITVTYNSSTNTFIINNTTGNTLTWCVFEIDYVKN